MSYKLLKSYTNMINVAHELTPEQRQDISERVRLGYEEDKKSMTDWIEKAQEIEDLASMEAVRKDTPRPNAANIKLPLITKACIEYYSRTYPLLFKDNKLVKSLSIGEDTPDKIQKGNKCTNYMNYQLLIKNKDWESEHGKLLFQTALIGWICKKQYYDPVKDKICTKLCDYKKIFVNSDITSLKDAPRISEDIELCLSYVMSRKNKESGGQTVYLGDVCDEIYEKHKLDKISKDICFVEQELYLDLDEDGIDEPYTAIVWKDNWKLVRLTARFKSEGIETQGDKILYITPVQYYVDYHFLPNPKGKYQSVGFGILLLHLTNSANSVLNALIDSSFFANMKSGFMDARANVLPTTSSFHRQGEFKSVKCLPGMTLKEAIYQLEYGEPSTVLFQLLGLLIQTAKDLSSSTEINSGTQNSQNAKTGATLALIKQGMATHEAIQKGHYRSLDTELKQLFDLNSIYLDKYQFIEYAGGQMSISKDDFDIKKVHVLPVADPNLSSDQERMQEAQIVMQLRQDPTIDPVKSMQFILSKINIPGIQDIMDTSGQKKPDPKMLEIQGKIQEAGDRLNLEGHKMELEHHDRSRQRIIQGHLAQGQLTMWLSQAKLNYAKAKQLGDETYLHDCEVQLEAIQTALNTKMSLLELDHQKDMQASDHAQQFMSQESDQEHQQGMQQDQNQPDKDMNEQEPSGGLNEQQSESGDTTN